MQLAIFYIEKIPTLYLLEKAARKVGFEPHLIHLRDIRFFVGEDGSDIRANNISLKNFDLIFIRGFWGYQHEVSLIGKFCRENKIALLDSALYDEPIISKNDDMFKFARHGLPVIKTIFLENKKSIPLLLKEFNFPIIAKEIRGKRGFDVYLLKNKKQLTEFLRQATPFEKNCDTRRYQFQKFIPSDFDIRVLVLDGKVLGAIERRSSDPKEFRNNISLGGIAKKIEISAEMENLALKAAKIMNYEFCGIDFIIDKNTGKLYILEINRSPGFEGFMHATGIDLPLELMKFFARYCVMFPLQSSIAFSLKKHRISALSRRLCICH